VLFLAGNGVVSSVVVRMPEMVVGSAVTDDTAADTTPVGSLAITGACGTVVERSSLVRPPEGGVPSDAVLTSLSGVLPSPVSSTPTDAVLTTSLSGVLPSPVSAGAGGSVDVSAGAVLTGSPAGCGDTGSAWDDVLAPEE